MPVPAAAAEREPEPGPAPDAGGAERAPDAQATTRPPGGRGAPTADRLVWIDLEMTGLDVERHTIVEIACLVTDSELRLLDDGIDLVVAAGEDELARMDDFVRRMHERSGLLHEIRGSQLDLATAGTRVLDYVRGFVPEPRTAPLFGNSIGTDRRFLDRLLPDLEHHLHYRSIDVSSFKELCRRWYPEEFKGRPGKSDAHRALDDIRESLAELAYYRDTILKPRPQPA